jgi:hypothetical protein
MSNYIMPTSGPLTSMKYKQALLYVRLAILALTPVEVIEYLN